MYISNKTKKQNTNHGFPKVNGLRRRKRDIFTFILNREK